MATKLRVSKSFVGEMVLPVIENRTLKAGYLLTLTDEQFDNFAVQSAIRRGLLSIEEGTTLDQKIEEVVKVKEKIVDSIIKNEIIEEVEREMSEEDKKELPTFEEITSEEKVPQKDDDFSTLNLDDIITREDVEKETSTKANMLSWDLENQKPLEKNESSSVLAKQMNSFDMDVKTTKEDKEIDLNSNIDVNEKIDEMTSKIKVGTIKKSKTKSKSLKPVGHKKEVGDGIFIDDVLPNEEEMLFVDQEQTAEAILNHPILKEKFKNNEDNSVQEN